MLSLITRKNEATQAAFELETIFKHSCEMKIIDFKFLPDKFFDNAFETASDVRSSSKPILVSSSRIGFTSSAGYIVIFSQRYKSKAISKHFVASILFVKFAIK